MRVKDFIIAAVLIITLVASVASFTMPSLLGRPMVPQMKQMAAPELPTQAITPEDVTAQAAEETFSLRVSGNVYYDKLPIEGAEVTIYLNGRQVGKATAGDIYMFDVPNVRMGDMVRVDATYEGFTGTASEAVKFKSMSLNVEITTGRSFIRNALDMLPTQDDISEAEQQPAQQAASQQVANAPTTSSADANQLTSRVFGDTSKQLVSMIGGANNAVANPVAMTNPADSGGNMNINDIQNTINAGGFPGIVS
jgi:hypothetical protein